MIFIGYVQEAPGYANKGWIVECHSLENGGAPIFDGFAKGGVFGVLTLGEKGQEKVDAFNATAPSGHGKSVVHAGMEARGTVFASGPAVVKEKL